MIGLKTCLTLLALASFVKGESTCCTVSQWESVQEFLSGRVGGGKAVETEVSIFHSIKPLSSS